MRNLLLWLSIILVLTSLLVGCGAQTYDEGYQAGFEQGYEEGHADGIVEGKSIVQPSPSIDKPIYSSDEVLAIVGNDFSTFLNDLKNQDLFGQTDNSGFWRSTYLGNGKWEVRLTYPKLVAIWYYYEKSNTLSYWGIKLN